MGQESRDVTVISLDERRHLILGEPALLDRCATMFHLQRVEERGPNVFDQVRRLLPVESRGGQSAILFEATPDSAAAFRDLRRIAAEDGFANATLLDESGRFAHVMKVRPAELPDAAKALAPALATISDQLDTIIEALDELQGMVGEVLDNQDATLLGQVHAAVDALRSYGRHVLAHGPSELQLSAVGPHSATLDANIAELTDRLRSAIARLEGKSAISAAASYRKRGSRMAQHLILLNEAIEASFGHSVVMAFHEISMNGDAAARSLVEQAVVRRDERRGRLLDLGGDLDRALRAASKNEGLAALHLLKGGFPMLNKARSSAEELAAAAELQASRITEFESRPAITATDVLPTLGVGQSRAEALTLEIVDDPVT